MKPLFNIHFVIFQQDINCYSPMSAILDVYEDYCQYFFFRTIYYSFSKKGLRWTQHDTITASQLVLPPALVLL